MPPGRVFKLLTRDETWHKWQPELIKVEHMIGAKGHVGAKTRCHYSTRGRAVTILQTILSKEVPTSIVYLYEADYMVHQGTNTLETRNDDKSTEIFNENEIKFKGLMWLFGWMMKPMLKRYGTRSLLNFKAYAEGLDANNQTSKSNPKPIR